ncbi:hypothetical protein DFH06DRAFT_1150097 [Mycena polygramma]|nr:hypothetical protein DFH06DRAFT_1150097 [Mycena polygramma]
MMRTDKQTDNEAETYKIDAAVEQEAQRPDPEQEHSIGSMKAERGRLKYSGSGLRGQFRTQGAPGSSRDEDEAQKPQAWRKRTTRELKKRDGGWGRKSVPETRPAGTSRSQAHVDPASSLSEAGAEPLGCRPELCGQPEALVHFAGYTIRMGQFENSSAAGSTFDLPTPEITDAELTT